MGSLFVIADLSQLGYFLVLFFFTNDEIEDLVTRRKKLSVLDGFRE